jgi:pimeloyl-ACP methyl ester carboxylesterase
MLAAAFDAWLGRLNQHHFLVREVFGGLPEFIPTEFGKIRVYDSRGQQPAVVLVPDGPCVIESYAHLIRLLLPHFRVICFDLPGFGHSYPSPTYTHSLEQGAKAVLAVLDALRVERTALAFSCANGFYALKVAELAGDRIVHLVLSQTPSPAAMHRWAKRIIPPVLHVPVLGQGVFWAVRQKAAQSWLHFAPAKSSQTANFAEPALQALAHGGCFCMVGAYQGLRPISNATFSSLKIPSTVVWGTRDRSHRHTKPESLLEILPHADVVRFEDAGHLPDLEQPARFAALLQERMI